MKKIFLFILLASVLPIFGQIDMDLKLNRQKNLKHEPVIAELVLTNNSGTRLIFGETKKSGYLSFEIVDNQNKLIPPKNPKFNPVKKLTLEAGRSRSLKLNLSAHYNLTKVGKYSIKAKISHPMIQNVDFKTKKAADLEVVDGSVAIKRNFGVVKVEKGEKKIYTRTYEIIGFDKDDGNIYFLKIHDKKFIYCLHRIGPKVKGIKLQHAIDSFSNVHVLAHVRPKLFKHIIYSPEGKLQQQKFYKGTKDIYPILNRDTDLGRVTILNGIPAVEGKDYHFNENARD